MVAHKSKRCKRVAANWQKCAAKGASSAASWTLRNGTQSDRGVSACYRCGMSTGDHAGLRLSLGAAVMVATKSAIHTTMSPRPRPLSQATELLAPHAGCAQSGSVGIGDNRRPPVQACD